MALFEELNATDILEPIMGLLQEKKMWLDEKDWKLRYDVNMMKASPWITAKYAIDRDCMAHTLYFNYYGIIPKTCRLCWKVNCKLISLRQLMKVKSLQLELDLPSKCGFEDENDRWASRKGGLYSAFWYVPISEGHPMGYSLEQAFRLKEFVESQLERVFGKSVGTKVKRGCTEMERSFGDSKDWDKLAIARNWDKKEELLDNIFIHEGRKYLTPQRLAWEHSYIETHKVRQWIIFAARNGDMTYTDFTEGPFGKDLRTYTKEDVYGGIELV